MFKCALCFLLFCIVTAEWDKENPMSAVLLKSLLITARSCMTNFNATEDDLEYLRNEPPYPHKAGCVVTCLLEKINVVKDKKFSKSGFLVVMTPLVFRNSKRLQHLKSVGRHCEREIKVKEDYCMLGSDIAVCVKKYAPEMRYNA